jgi:SAM-dependent methyltransferase
MALLAIWTLTVYGNHKRKGCRLSDLHMCSNFRQYAKYYDLINRDKPYALEAAYVAGRLRDVCPGLSTVMELGSGTGRHGRLLAAQGFHVHGIELSREMVELGQGVGMLSPGSFQCSVGDIRSIRLARQFDAVVALFHVISYQITQLDFTAALDTAAHHLTTGGLFLFDVWHGPAVLFQRPSAREKIVIDGSLRVVRKATPELRTQDNVVVVNYDFTCVDGEVRSQLTFSEQHLMRYFFPDEILFATSKTFKCLLAEEMLTAAPPSVDTWAVAYLFQKR